MVARNADISENERMLLRIGINIGEVIIEDDDIYGDGVNVAARMQEIAEPGGLAISGNVHEQIEGKLDANFHDDGTHQVKNIARPVRDWRWSPLVGRVPAAEKTDATRVVPDKPSIAVLPFDNMSSDSEHQSLADGIAEDIGSARGKFFAISKFGDGPSLRSEKSVLEAVESTGDKLVAMVAKREFYVRTKYVQRRQRVRQV